MNVTHGDPRPRHTKGDATVLRSPGHTVVKLRGELDIAATPHLRQRLAALLSPAPPLLVLDLSGVSFCDASGLALLIGLRRRAAPLGTDLVLVGLRPYLVRVLHASGLDRALTVRPTLAAALTRSPAARVRPSLPSAAPTR